MNIEYIFKHKTLDLSIVFTIEEENGEWSASLECKDHFSIHTMGDTVEKALDNIVDLMKDLKSHEDLNVEFWKDINMEDFKRTVTYSDENLDALLTTLQIITKIKTINQSWVSKTP